MNELVFTTFVSTLTPIFTALLPLLAAATGRNALKADIELYKEWSDVVRGEEDAAALRCGQAIATGQDPSGASSAPAAAAEPAAAGPTDARDAASPSAPPPASPAALEVAPVSPGAAQDPKMPKIPVPPSAYIGSEYALRVFRAGIDYRLRQRAHRGGHDIYLYGGILIVLLAGYVIMQCLFNQEGLVDDLLRSFLFFASSLIVVLVFSMRGIHQVNNRLQKLAKETPAS